MAHITSFPLTTFGPSSKVPRIIVRFFRELQPKKVTVEASGVAPAFPKERR